MCFGGGGGKHRSTYYCTDYLAAKQRGLLGSRRGQGHQQSLLPSSAPSCGPHSFTSGNNRLPFTSQVQGPHLLTYPHNNPTTTPVTLMVLLFPFYVLNFNLLISERERGREGEREKHQFVVPFIYAVTG